MESPIDKQQKSQSPENPSLQSIHDTASVVSKAEGEMGGNGVVCINHRGMSRGIRV
jgi:hypothetical protein